MAKDLAPAEQQSIHHLLGVLSREGFDAYTIDDPQAARYSPGNARKLRRFERHNHSIIAEAIRAAEADGGIKIDKDKIDLSVQVNAEGFAKLRKKIMDYFYVKDEEVSPILAFLHLLSVDGQESPNGADGQEPPSGGKRQKSYKYTIPADKKYDELRDLIKECKDFDFITVHCTPHRDVSQMFAGNTPASGHHAEQASRLQAIIRQKIIDKDPSFQLKGLTTALQASTYYGDETTYERIWAPAIGTGIGFIFGFLAEKVNLIAPVTALTHATGVGRGSEDLINAIVTGIAVLPPLAAGDALENFQGNLSAKQNEARSKGLSKATAFRENAVESAEGALAAIPLTGIGTVMSMLPAPFGIARFIGGAFTSVATSGGLETASLDAQQRNTRAYKQLIESGRLPPIPEMIESQELGDKRIALQSQLAGANSARAAEIKAEIEKIDMHDYTVPAPFNVVLTVL